ncbi:hypothetical protein [Nostoc sp. WHI]|uniref:hypothetical protein n=1 Tax=Nostoc sp. WHI TaxID=2650611 RepID=UPI0018C8506C|nr:hypothetical protein [Nostoc sp. WHI]MBG1271313.1 type II toxin-antitoxin system VapC family toxin [Nostoc sp. WHI]
MLIDRNIIIYSAQLENAQLRVTLGDAIIAGTPLVSRLTLITRNIDDFRWITQVRLWNPFEFDKTQLTEKCVGVARRRHRLR